uniref:Uncharacterized protein n=1 Tax=Parascaris equorum TaxID=6256 RepID=A0A914RLS0_PAREQ
MTEMIGYEGPIYMTYPTKAIAPVLLVRFLCRYFSITYGVDSPTVGMVKSGFMWIMLEC